MSGTQGALPQDAPTPEFVVVKIHRSRLDLSYMSLVPGAALSPRLRPEPAGPWEVVRYSNAIAVEKKVGKLGHYYIKVQRSGPAQDEPEYVFTEAEAAEVCAALNRVAGGSPLRAGGGAPPDTRASAQDIADAAQSYLNSQEMVGCTEEQQRAIRHKLGSLIGPYARCYTARAGEGEKP